MRLSKSSIITVVAVLLSIAMAFIPSTDQVGESYVDSAFQRALIGFAIARSLNGVISVAQGTELAVQPAGVGLSFTPGEILDPINDLVERFSWIMLLATSSLGIQKVLLSMSAWQGLLFGLLGVGFLLVVSHVVFSNQRLRVVLGRVFLFMLLLRFMMPAIAIANNWVYDTFLSEDYTLATEQLRHAEQEIGQLNAKVQTEKAVPDGFVARAKELYQQVANQVDIDARFAEYKLAAESISENTIHLIVVFVMQTVVFPVLFLMIVTGLARRLMRW